MATVIRTIRDRNDVFLRKVDVVNWLLECALSQSDEGKMEILHSAALAIKDKF